MCRINILLILILSFSNNTIAQNFTNILINVDTLFMPGAAPGHLSPIDQAVTPIVSSSPCNIPQFHFSVATEYQNGRVMAIAHEGLLVNGSINSSDNLTFLTNAMNWLNPGNKRVLLKEGWANNGNTSILQNALAADGFTFGILNGSITSASLTNTDILILGNDWNGTQPYSASTLTVLDNFVANGGAIFIAGLGWSWPQDLSLYPMNAVANLFGFAFTTDVINDPGANVNGAPKLYSFYPENLDTSGTPYCPSPFIGTNLGRGDNLRLFRLAVSTTGEFTQQSGGAASTELLLNQWLEDINDIYGREYCVRFEIIPNNNQLIFSTPDSDPWSTLPAGSGGCTNAGLILSQQATVIDNIIGAANYDISHVIAGAPFGGGCASGLKSGLSGGFDIPVTRHEMGHQFSQAHTINHTDNNNYEPENGAWTIQGGNGQGYGHAVSYHQLANFLLNNIPNVGTQIPTNNTIPVVNAGADFIIPISTPFTLTGVATDPDAEDNLTYVWDNMNRGIAQTLPIADDAQGAIFMRLLPDPSPSRTFPNMNDVVANNNSNAQEQLPTQPRIMDIRLTVNDNHKMQYNGELVNASGTQSDDVQITVADAGPLVVTSQNTDGIIYLGESSQMVTWEVNGTNELPINTQNVRISLSTDGGYTYPFVLLESTANNGSAMVTMPNVSTSSARIRVSAVDNIYFDLNTNDFEIQSVITSTEHIKTNAFPVEIQPNPVKDTFKIQLPKELKFSANLYNANGVLLITKLNKQFFDVSEFSEGLYILEVLDLDTNQKVTKKFVVSK